MFFSKNEIQAEIDIIRAMTQESPAHAPPPTPLPTTLDEVSRHWLTSLLGDIEAAADKDVVVIMGEISPGLDLRVRMALEHLKDRRRSSLVILETPGGIVEVVVRISDTLRRFHNSVDFLIPNQAMSAGTVLALSGNAIWMDYFSRLGPIDPQVERDGRLVPGLSYLRQYDDLIKKSEKHPLTDAELTLLSKLDLAELHQIDLAAKRSVQLIKEWLPRYKFKDWKKSGKPVEDGEKTERAEKIASELNNHQRWFTHARGIDMETLRELGLQIKDFGEENDLKESVWRYFWAAQEFAHKQQYSLFVHSRSFI